MLQCQRSHFTLPGDTTYLNCAYMSPLPRRVVEAGIQGVRRKANPADITPPDFFSGPDRVRTLFAQLINAPAPAQIAIVPSASYAMAIVSRNLRIEPHQNIVTVQAQFPSNMYPWRRLCADHGAELRVVVPAAPGTEGRGEAWNEAVLAAIDASTAMVAIANVHWTDGTVFDLERIGTRAREAGALLVIDGTQSIGAMPFDVARVRPDLVACSAYKWLMGPYSIGACYVGDRLLDGVPLEETWMGREGSAQFGGLVDYQDRYRPGAIRYDVGESSNFVLVPMFVAALELLLELGVSEIGEYCGRMSAGATGALVEAGFGLECDGFRAPHLFGFSLPAGVTPADVQARLEKEKVIVSVRGAAVRVSPNVYNDEDDMQRFVRALCQG